MSDIDERRAASVILKDLALFNKAAIFVEQKIQPTILMAISELVRDWLERCGWRGTSDIIKEVVWVCPSKWKEENEEPIARFRFTPRPGVEITFYDVADMCGVGTTDWGFQFEVTHSWFGGKAAWGTLVKGMAGLTDEVVKKGWTNVGKGVFFRPVKLRADLLADAWESEDWSEVLAPLGQALNALVADQAIFDKIIMTASPKTK